MTASKWKAFVWLPALVLAGGAAACVGQIGDPSNSGDGPLACDSAAIYPGDAPARRMTRFEYNNTVRDLLGATGSPADAFPADEVAGIFNNQASALVVTELLAEGYMNAAESVAGTAVQDLSKLVGCDPQASGADVCGAQFIDSFGQRAFRRPLDTDGRALLQSVFDAALAKWDYPTAIRLVIETALQSPRFLYRLEFGMPSPNADGVVKLDDYEVASRLSYLLWGSMPDDALFAAAAKGELSKPEQVAEQARRMLADPRARDTIANFHEQWLGLVNLPKVDKDTNVFPQYNAALKDTWKAETLAFVNDVIFDGDGDVATLLSAPYTMMNADVAAFYGMSDGPTGAAFERVDLDPAQRAGLLTQPSILAVNAHADQTSPVHRGKFVRERLLCEPISPPPPNVNAVPPPVDPNATTRERFAQHSTDPACAGCHKLMDPVGFGFENYDGVGLWRDEDQGIPVDASGEVVGSKDSNGKFVGAVELAQRLAKSEEVRACVVKQWFRYGHGRPDTKDDACTMAQLQQAFSAAKYDVKELMVALTQTDAFLYRKRVQAGQ
ncbi:MAG: DUF1592 domain-containing protein [Minicystis sp.]